MHIKSKIKLGPLSKSALRDDRMKYLKGAEYYCDWGPGNLRANAHDGKCSCYCVGNPSYYDTSTGLQAFGDWIKVNW